MSIPKRWQEMNHTEKILILLRIHSYFIIPFYYYFTHIRSLKYSSYSYLTTCMMLLIPDTYKRITKLIWTPKYSLEFCVFGLLAALSNLIMCLSNRKFLWMIRIIYKYFSKVMILNEGDYVSDILQAYSLHPVHINQRWSEYEWIRVLD